MKPLQLKPLPVASMVPPGERRCRRRLEALALSLLILSLLNQDPVIAERKHCVRNGIQWFEEPLNQARSPHVVVI
jgi:hypothetical protein